MSAPVVCIYGPPMAPFVEKVQRALILKKLPYEIIEPSGPEDYQRWNPETGLLPVADIDGTRVADSVRILDALDERYPEPPLVSSDPRAAASQRALERWAGETFFFYWVSYLRARVSAGETAPAEDVVSGPLARLGILRRVMERGPASIPVETGNEALGEEFARRIADLDGFLGSRPYFYGDRISRADLSVHTFLRTLTRNEIPDAGPLLAAHPRLTVLMQRVEAQTSIETT